MVQVSYGLWCFSFLGKDYSSSYSFTLKSEVLSRDAMILFCHFLQYFCTGILQVLYVHLCSFSGLPIGFPISFLFRVLRIIGCQIGLWISTISWK